MSDTAQFQTRSRYGQADVLERLQNAAGVGLVGCGASARHPGTLAAAYRLHARACAVGRGLAQTATHACNEGSTGKVHCARLCSSFKRSSPQPASGDLLPFLEDGESLRNCHASFRSAGRKSRASRRSRTSICDVVDGDFSASTLSAFIEALQVHEPLRVDELWNVAPFLQFALLELLLVDVRALQDSPNSDLVPHLPRVSRACAPFINSDWVPLIEPLIVFDALFARTPRRPTRTWNSRAVSAIANALRSSRATPIAQNQKWLSRARSGPGGA